MSTTPIAPDEGDFDTGPPFVFGFGFRDGAGVSMRWEEAAAGESFDWLWLHLNMNNDATREWIGAQAGIPFAAQSALLAGETRPRVSGFDNGLVVNLRGVNLNEGAEPEDMVSMRIWLDSRRLITTRRRRLKAAQDIRDEIIAGLTIASPGELLARLAELGLRPALSPMSKKSKTSSTRSRTISLKAQARGAGLGLPKCVRRRCSSAGLSHRSAMS